MAIKKETEPKIEAKETNTSKKVEKDEKIQGQVVYVGDNRAPDLIHGTVYVDGIPPSIDLEKEPMLKFLFVPISELIQALKDRETEGTRIHVANKSLRGGK